MKRRASVIFINSLSTYARMGISMFLSLFITRTALDILAQNSPAPKEVFGIFMLLISTSTAIQFLNESTQQAMVRFLSISLQNRDWHQTKQLFNNGWLMSTVIGSSIAVVMAILAPWIITCFNIPEELITQAKYVVWLSALAQVINAVSQPWYAALSAEERYTLVNFLSVLQQVLILIGLNLLRFLPINLLVGMTLVWLTPGAIIGILLAGWLTLQKPFLRLDWHVINWQDSKKLFSLGGWSSLIGFASNLYERTDQILINLLLGPALNAIYAIALQLGSALNRLVTSLTTVLLPAASRLSDSGSVWEKQQLILRSTRYVLTLALPAAFGVGIFRREIIELWLGKGFEQAIAILPLTIFLVFSRIPIFVTWPYLTATNQLKLPALAILLDGVCNVFLSILYVKEFNLGLAGIVLGTLSTNLIRFIFFQIPLVAKLVELPISQYWLKGYTRPIIPMLWLVPTLWLIEVWKLPIYLTISLLLVSAVLYTISVWFWVFDEYERKLFIDILTHVLRSKKAHSN
ncbi:putative membrane protein EpsK [Nostoc sp. NIES-4103]|nr:putative membrane protein EpsK [Nostoc sp. NIES-4103]